MSGGCVLAIGVLLFITIPATGRLVEDSRRRSIQNEYAPREVLESESPRFRALQKKYDETVGDLVAGRLADRAMITFEIIVIGALLFGWGRTKEKRLR